MLKKTNQSRMISVKDRVVHWQQWPGLAASTHHPLHNAGLNSASSTSRAKFRLPSEELSGPR